ncbi:hypothetical protein HZC07_04835 [Candidatus Micrarchaeota archaeon]|nr:hypothetical protein [Candidatus Micrarchaeota archaeon]
MSIKLTLSFLIAFLLFGCIQDNSELTKEKLTESEDQLTIGLQKYEEGSIAFNNEKFFEARQRFSEAKTYFTTANTKFSEACSLSPEVCSENVTKSIDSCLLPLVDLSMGLTYLSDDVKSQCTDTCPGSVRSKCIDLLATAKNADTSCKQASSFDPKTADSVQEICKSVFPG